MLRWARKTVSFYDRFLTLCARTLTLLVGFPALLTRFLPPMGGHESIILTAIAGLGTRDWGLGRKAGDWGRGTGDWEGAFNRKGRKGRREQHLRLQNADLPAVARRALGRAKEGCRVQNGRQRQEATGNGVSHMPAGNWVIGGHLTGNWGTPYYFPTSTGPTLCRLGGRRQKDVGSVDPTYH